MRIAVVGLGAIGSQVLRALATHSGVEAHGFETHFPGHPTAGAGGENRVYWNLELVDPGYSPLIVRAREAWARLEQDAAERLIDRTGTLVLGETDAVQFTTALASATDTGAAIELLDGEDLARRFPQFGRTPGTGGIWDVDGGIIRPEASIAAATRLAVVAGAQVHEFDRVLAVRPLAQGVEIETSHGIQHFDRAVVAAGGWTPRLLPYLREEIVARRLVSLWFHGSDLAGMPPFLQTAPSYCYGIPLPDGRSVKVGLGFNDHLVIGDPDAAPRHLQGTDLALQLEKFAWIPERVIPSLASRPHRVGTYVESYTRSMLEHIAFHPESNDVLVLAGFSGHGFRVAPAMGEIGAELITSGDTSSDLGFLAAAAPMFEIIDPEAGTTTHNSAMTSNGTGNGNVR